jgi:hypothetical protein
VDRGGKLLARRRISDDAAGFAGLLALLAEHGDTPGDPVPAAIETPRGLLVACLRATERAVYPVNPMAVARYRDRHSASGKKSDHGDSAVLAHVLRIDQDMHRPLPADSELAQAIAGDGSQVGARSREPPRGDQYLGRSQDVHHHSMSTCGAR